MDDVNNKLNGMYKKEYKNKGTLNENNEPKSGNFNASKPNEPKSGEFNASKPNDKRGKIRRVQCVVTKQQIF